MKLSTAASAAPFLTLAAAFVMPDVPVVQQALSEAQVFHHSTFSADDGGDQSVLRTWWDAIPSTDDLVSALDESLDTLSSGFEHLLNSVENDETSITNQLSDAVDEAASVLGGGGRHHRRHGHDFPDLTVYQLLHLSNYTTKFAKLVDEHPKIVKLLNNTDNDDKLTLLVPLDSAFDDIPEDHEKPSDEMIEHALLYHILPSPYPAKKIFLAHTVPTALEEKLLGGEPQRLRINAGLLLGINVNFYSKVVAADIGAKNGVIHVVRKLLVPPPPAGPLLGLFPQYFSTLLLGMEKTDLVKEIHSLTAYGSTIFAPTNSAFAWLGPRVNAYLFNTESGLKHLRALLKYHVVVNATLYTDSFTDKTGDEDEAAQAIEHQHYELQPLLEGAHVDVDTYTFKAGFVSTRINHRVRPKIRDVVSKTGSVHVINRVLFPRKSDKHDAMDEYEMSDMSVEEFKERLAGYVE